MDLLILIGRILFVGIFLASAMAHFTQTDGMAAYAQSKKVPAPRAAVLGGGVLMLVGGLSVLLGIWPDLGALLLLIFLLPTAVLMHDFWTVRDPEARSTEQIQFFKDLSLAGAALILLGAFAKLGDDLGLVMVAPLFG